MEQYFLGIDGGQTHTTATLLTSDDHVVARTSAGPAHIPGREPAQTWAEVAAQLITPLAPYSANIATVGIGATDIGAAGTTPATIERAVRDHLPRATVVCANDAVAAWWGAGGGEDSAIIIAGTGSIAYGVWSGHAVRLGGFGHLLGDEGSGSWIAIMALRHILKAADGRAAATRLTDAAVTYFEVTDTRSLLPMTYAPAGVPLAHIAGFSRHVGAVADAGDVVAQSLLRNAATELAQLTISLTEQLAVGHQEPMSVSAIGRTWDISPVLREHCQRVVAHSFPNVLWATPRADPSWGAAWMARTALRA